jgi:hypothetical protein
MEEARFTCLFVDLCSAQLQALKGNIKEDNYCKWLCHNGLSLKNLSYLQFYKIMQWKYFDYYELKLNGSRVCWLYEEGL